jgi:hypothetical protein
VFIGFWGKFPLTLAATDQLKYSSQPSSTNTQLLSRAGEWRMQKGTAVFIIIPHTIHLILLQHIHCHQ